MSGIVLRRVSKAYGEEQVLENFSAVFPAGETTCILGPSGCGKTTLLNLIAGLQKADAGEIEGVPERIAFVFQEDRLSEDFSAVSNVRLVTGKKVPKEEIIARLKEIGLGDSLKKPVRELSGGMKRRVAIVRAICYRPELLILDEPFKGLDEKLRGEVMDFVKRNTAGKTVICVTHERDDANRLGGGIIEMEKLPVRNDPVSE